MTPEIVTHFDETQGHGSIEMRPPPDEEGREIIHGLGIMGISYINERLGPAGECMTFVFGHTKQEKLTKTAKSIVEALSQPD